MPTARRHGGFRLGRKLLSVWRWALCHRRRRRGRGYLRLKPYRYRRGDAGAGDDASSSPAAFFPSDSIKKPQQQHHHHQHQDASSSPRRVLTWGRSLARRMRLLRRRKEEGRLLEDAAEEATTPKGQVAVYVGSAEPGGESMRYVVPVVYFNHPMFGELLREAEEEFGFHHPGGITIPCAASRFERAAAVAAAGKTKVPGPAGWW